MSKGLAFRTPVGVNEHVVVASPIGDLHLTLDGNALTGLYVSNHPAVENLGPSTIKPSSLARAVERELNAYWGGTLRGFSIPLAPRGTEWQTKVWAELVKVPYGRTITYLELARRVQRPRAARAVGSANARNPISVLIPCHRVIASTGKLTGYAGGLDRKGWLLHHERGRQATSVPFAGTE